MAIVERPAAVNAAIARLCPELSPATRDIVYGVESEVWNAELLTAVAIAHDSPM